MSTYHENCCLFILINEWVNIKFKQMTLMNEKR
jgi:hypothetical protein